MSGLPKGWVEASLGEVAQFVMGQAPPGSACNFDGLGIPFVKAGEFGELRPIIREWTTQPLKFATRDDVLVCVVGATAGKINLGENCSIGRSVAAIRPDGSASRDFIFNFLKTKITHLRQGSVGSAQGVISKDDLGYLKLPLPPLAEQKRIVAKLEALNAKSARARTELARIETLVSRYKQAVLSKAFRGELTREWRRGEGIEAWLSAKPEDLFRWSSGKNLPSREYTGGCVPVIGGNGVSGYHDIANTEESTIVIGRVGALCGNVYCSKEPAWITDNAIYAKWIAPEVNLLFAVLVYEVADLNKMSGGTGQPYVNQSILNSIDFPLPTITEQHEIVRRIESAFAKIDRLAAQAKRALELVGRLDEAILAKAFRGELVPQDETDEPADRLLARIRAERQAAPKAKRGRRAQA